jgi:hypothetical protein
MNTAAEVIAGKALSSCERGDVLDFLAALPPDACDLVFCSPPYSNCRLYLENGEDLGIARDAEEWAAWMKDVFVACLRVCTGLVACVCDDQTKAYRYGCAPYLLMADLHRAGVCLRRPCIYRRVGIPGSGGPDYLRSDYEPIICATRGGRLPWADPTACGHEPVYGPGGELSYRTLDGSRVNDRRRIKGAAGAGRRADGGRRSEEAWARKGFAQPVRANPGNVVDCRVGGGRMGNPLAHENEAPFPEELATFFVLTFCPPGGIVLDPFAGSGTTLAAAVRQGRRAIGCDLRQSQVELTRRRLAGETPSLFGAAGEGPCPGAPE